jgi:cysteinyl-tRNA synthetase
MDHFTSSSLLMTLFLSNTLTKKKEAFVPIDPTNVKIYSCGPTVYRDVHIGNMRAFAFASLLNSIITHILGYPVTHIMNLTDV